MDYPPISVFGLEALKNILQEEEKNGFESEAIAAAAAVQGFSVARLKPSYARQHHFPLYVPAPAQGQSANDYAVTAVKVLQSGLASPLLRHFADKMSEDGAEAPTVL